MRKSIRGLIVVAAALMALAGGGAHADTTVTFATEDGALMFSLPSGASDRITGTATDAVAVTAVHLLLEGPYIPSPENPETTVPVQTINADAQLTCNDDPGDPNADPPVPPTPPTECFWSLEVPFVVVPGEWKITATAYGLTADPDNPSTASASIDVTIL